MAGAANAGNNRDRTLELLMTLQSDVSTQIGNIMQTMDTRVEKSSKKWMDKIGEMKDKVFTFSNAIQGAIGSSVIKEGVGALKEYEDKLNQMTSLKLNRKFSGVLADFERINELTGGLANQKDMMGSINKAFSFGIDLSEGRLKDLLDVSRKTAIVMGTDMRTAFDDLITGVSRESMMILDNLGVVVNMTQAKEDYAKSINKTVDALTKEENKIAILNATTGKLKENLADIDMNLIANRVGSSTKSIEDRLTEAKYWLAEGFVDFADNLGYFTASMVSDTTIISSKATDTAARFQLDFVNAMKVVATESDKTYYSIDDLNATVQTLQNRYEALDAELTDKSIPLNSKIINQMLDMQMAIDNLSNKLIDIPDTLSATQLQMESVFATSLDGITKKFDDKLKATTDKRNNYREKKKQEAIKKEEEFLNLLMATEENNAKESAALQEEQTTANKNKLFAEIEFAKQIEELQRGKTLSAEEYLKLFEKFDTAAFKVSRSFAALGLVEQTRQNDIIDGIREEIKAREDLNAKIDKIFETERDKQDEKQKGKKGLLDDNEMSVKFLKMFGVEFDSEMSDESLKKWQLHFDQMVNIAEIGTGLIGNISDRMYDNFIARQDIFNKEMFGLALTQAGGEIYADGVKNAWIGGAQMILGVPTGSALFGWGLGEIATGIGMGAMGRSLAPVDDSSGEGEKRKESQQSVIVQMGNIALYPSRVDATRAIREVV